MTVFRFLLMLLNVSIDIQIRQSGNVLWFGSDKVETLEWLVSSGLDTKQVLCWQVVTVTYIGNDEIQNVYIEITICE